MKTLTAAVMDAKRLFPLSGIAFVLLVVATIVVVGGSAPGTDDSHAKVASFYSDNEVRQFVATFMLAATVPFLVLFAVGLAAALAQPHGSWSSWGAVVIAGAVLTGGAILATALIHFALADAASDADASAAAVQALNALDGSTWVAFNAGFGVMMLGAAGALLTAGVLRWLGWIALVVGIAAFIPVADFFALLATLLWIVVAGLMLARQAASPGRRPELGGEPTPATTT